MYSNHLTSLVDMNQKICNHFLNGRCANRKTDTGCITSNGFRMYHPVQNKNKPIYKTCHVIGKSTDLNTNKNLNKNTDSNVNNSVGKSDNND